MSVNDEHRPNPVRAPAATHALLRRLHDQSLAQESKLDLHAVPRESFGAVMADQFVALEEDKCQFVYTLLRASGATTVVEAGTSFGVSTIYLALAAAQNALDRDRGGRPLVVGTEHEPAKAQQAHKYWAEAGVDSAIDLRVGDLRETLKTGLADVGFLLLDIWAPMALPALELVRPHLRPGATIVVDNIIRSAERYAELLAYVRADEAFQRLTVPYHNGLAVWVYSPAV